jgi:DNA polymerase I-like protein with 3'-5' exonuclease and polymerase domains
MQLAKRGESTYVRGFFEADYDDHVIVSIDWSSIELVEIGELSGDPEFIKAYGQIPHEDLHAGSAADILSVEVPGLTEKIFKDVRNYDSWESYQDVYKGDITNVSRLRTDLKGQELGVEKAYKYWRTEVGKGANFNYWYSGFLSTIGERMGWTMDTTAQATDRYRARFAVAENWRVNLIHEGQANGFVTLPDGHRRVRFEATPRWAEYFAGKFLLPGSRDDDLTRRYNAVIHYITRKIAGRANNQLVNSMIQGTCATIAKRSVLRAVEAFKAAGWTNREARFMIPIHDELVFSVHKSLVAEFINMVRTIMITHPEIFTKCKLDASPSVGLTFEPFGKKAPFGQIELFEMPDIGIGTPNGRANDSEIGQVVDYLFAQRKAA